MSLNPTAALGVVLTVLTALVWLVIRTDARVEHRQDIPLNDLARFGLDPAAVTAAAAQIARDRDQRPDADADAFARRAARLPPAAPVRSYDWPLLYVPFTPEAVEDLPATQARPVRTHTGVTATAFPIAVEIAHRRAQHTGLRHCIHHEPNGTWYIHLAHPRAPRP